MHFDVTDFTTQVIEKSHETPVLVDFWAAWCGPCRMLSPVLEEMAAEAGGKWVLAKVNVEEQKRAAMDYGVRGIPDVHLIYKGEDIGRFTGALPKSGIQQFLDKHLPSAERESLMQAKEMLAAGQSEQAEELLTRLLQAGDNPDAKLLLAKTLLFQDPQQASSLIADIHAGHPLHAETEDLQVLMDLLQKQSDDLEDVPIREKYLGAIEALRAKDFSAALERFIEVIMINKAYDDEGARKACIAIFHYLGEQHEISKKYRKRFSMALY